VGFERFNAKDYARENSCIAVVPSCLRFVGIERGVSEIQEDSDTMKLVFFGTNVGDSLVFRSRSGERHLLGNSEVNAD
jgi:hypothetical protein